MDRLGSKNKDQLLDVIEEKKAQSIYLKRINNSGHAALVDLMFKEIKRFFLLKD